VSVERRLADTPAMTDPGPAQQAPLRILVVDPDEWVRESLVGLLCIGGECAVVGSAGEADDAIALAAVLRPDVVLLDPRLPAMDGGRALISCLREAVPGVRVLVLNWSEAAAGSASADGADAYIKKTFHPHQLIDAVVAASRTSVA
jgi:DNA-binding NarL/FixJ family response regulator